jgi:chorismate-pyruvate lyase
MREADIFLPPGPVTDFGTGLLADPERPGMSGWAGPLEWCYAKAGLSLPSLEPLRPHEVRRPHRALLVHSEDMTPTLEGFFEQPLGLTVLSSEQEGDSYRREVLLTLGLERCPVLYGAIRVCLPHFPARARGLIVKGRSPLGRILQTEAIAHMSWPHPFFRLDPDSHISAMLRLRRTCKLYGRRNVLVDGSRRLLAEVIEVLPPIRDAKVESGLRERPNPKPDTDPNE